MGGYRENVNPSAAEVTEGDQSASLLSFRMAAAVGLLVALGVFVLVALVAPDAGLSATSLGQGVALAAVFAAAPIAALAPQADATSLVALGGGMTVAGAATTPDGNFLGVVMVASGVLRLLVGGFHRPSLTAGLMGRLLGYAIVLAAGILLAIDAAMWTGVAGIVVAVMVSSSTRWRRLGQPQ